MGEATKSIEKKKKQKCQEELDKIDEELNASDGISFSSDDNDSQDDLDEHNS